MVKLQFDLNKQYKITLPKAIIEAKGWKKGDIVSIGLDNKGNIILSIKGKGGEKQ
ncbi:MAG: AbrB/MazE/SpoVT family DNA-binding domain-containing protein [Candidatus Woesearchaeota archaeon]|nr:AbrB/MazE/SpoVT family DNA-binding domain-containing protein [Candidatus Woesearchaeota archaeon]